MTEQKNNLNPQQIERLFKTFLMEEVQEKPQPKNKKELVLATKEKYKVGKKKARKILALKKKARK
jgi:hypothetical protein